MTHKPCPPALKRELTEADFARDVREVLCLDPANDRVEIVGKTVVVNGEYEISFADLLDKVRRDCGPRITIGDLSE